MNSSSKILFHHVASAPSSLDIMMSDEDSTSRDSGICEIMDENTPVCFSSLSIDAVESMEVDEVMSRPGKVSLRREKSSCKVRLFDNKTPVAPRPSLSLRPINQQGFNPQQVVPLSEELGNLKKRIMVFDSDDEYGRQSKLPRRESISSSYQHYHIECSEGVDDDDDSTERKEEEEENLFAFVKPLERFTYMRTTSNPALGNGEEGEEDRIVDLEKHHLRVEYHLGASTLNAGSSCFRRISPKQMIRIFEKHTQQSFNDKYILIDCRYPFEYNGGHVKYALNFYNPDNVAQLFYNDKNEPLHNRIPIFYCEFSQKRGPSMANALRKVDREANMTRYPYVAFAEMYVIDKGYKQFYSAAKKYTDMCVPNSYVEMTHPDHTEILKTFNFHRRSAVGQSVFRALSAPAIVHASRPSTASNNASSPQSRRNPAPQGITTTPAAFSRQASARCLYPEANKPNSPRPQPHLQPLTSMDSPSDYERAQREPIRPGSVIHLPDTPSTPCGTLNLDCSPPSQ